MYKQYKNIYPIKHLSSPSLIDSRFSITKEYCGLNKPRAVFRFCDEFIHSYTTRKEAIYAAKQYQERLYSDHG
jgi:hypothetical protein